MNFTAELNSQSMLTAMLVVVGVIQIVLVWIQAAVALRLGRIEQARRDEEGTDLIWHRVRDTMTVGGGTYELTAGHIIQLVVANRGRRDEMIWDPDIRLIGTVRDGAYEVNLGLFPDDHRSGDPIKVDQVHMLIPGHGARRLQAWIKAEPQEVAALNDGWLFLRYYTPDGPTYRMLQSGDGEQPPEDYVMLGLQPSKGTG